MPHPLVQRNTSSLVSPATGPNWREKLVYLSISAASPVRTLWPTFSLGGRATRTDSQPKLTPFPRTKNVTATMCVRISRRPERGGGIQPAFNVRTDVPVIPAALHTRRERHPSVPADDHRGPGLDINTARTSGALRGGAKLGFLIPANKRPRLVPPSDSSPRPRLARSCAGMWPSHEVTLHQMVTFVNTVNSGYLALLSASSTLSSIKTTHAVKEHLAVTEELLGWRQAGREWRVLVAEYL